MAKKQIILPAMGEGIVEAEITRWLVKEGQAVRADEPVVEVATDKVDSEVVAPANGILQKILAFEGESPKTGQVIAIVSTDDESIREEEKEEREVRVPDPPPAKTTDSARNPGTQGEMEHATQSHRYADIAFLSPVVRKIARENSLSPQEITGIPGSGIGGRITRSDINNYVRDRTKKPRVTEPSGMPAGGTEESLSNGKPDTPISGTQDAPGHTRITMDRIRQKIADHMVYSSKTAPHVTSIIECDVTAMMEWRSRVMGDFETRYGQKLTVTPLVVESVIKALKEYSGINVSVEGNAVIYKKELNIGMATALPAGNLIVPVIRDADRLNLAGLATAVNDLAERARKNTLQPSEITGGTFTVTNIGQFGNIAGTPIINQPEVAILAIGVIRKMPSVMETRKGDAIGIRQRLMLSLAYDHRVVDGSLGGSFLKSIGDHLQNFDPERII